MRAASPREGEPRHLGEHAGAVVDERDRCHRVLTLVLFPVSLVGAFQHNVDLRCAGFDAIVHDFARRCSSVAVAATLLQRRAKSWTMASKPAQRRSTLCWNAPTRETGNNTSVRTR